MVSTSTSRVRAVFVGVFHEIGGLWSWCLLAKIVFSCTLWNWDLSLILRVSMNLVRNSMVTCQSSLLTKDSLLLEIHWPLPLCSFHQIIQPLENFSSLRGDRETFIWIWNIPLSLLHILRRRPVNCLRLNLLKEYPRNQLLLKYFWLLIYLYCVWLGLYASSMSKTLRRRLSTRRKGKKQPQEAKPDKNGNSPNGMNVLSSNRTTIQDQEQGSYCFTL